MIAMRALKQALEKRTFDRAYLFHGDDDFLKEEKVRALVDRATDAATREFNLDVRRGSEATVADVTQILGSAPMMAERRVLVIRDAAALKKDACAALLLWLSRATPDVLLLLVAGSGTKVDARLLAVASTIEFKHLSERDVVAWAREHAAARGARFMPGALELLVGATGNDLALLAGEVAKLLAYAGEDEISEGAVTDVVGVRRGATTADLLDAAAERDGARAAALVEPVLAQPKTSAVPVLMALTTQTLAIAWALAARANGMAQHQLEREFFGLLKENPSAVVGRPWGEAVKTWVRALPRWDQSAADHALERLMATEAALKDTRISSDEQMLRTLVLAIGVRESRQRDSRPA